MALSSKFQIGFSGFLLALLLIGGSAFAQFKADMASLNKNSVAIAPIEGDQGTAVQKVENGLHILVDDTSRFAFSVWGNGLVRLAPKSEARVSTDASNWPRKLKLDVKNGRFWVNTRASITETSITAGTIEVLLSPGVFDVQYEKGLLVVVALRRNAVVRLGDRHLVIPEHRQMIIDTAKVASQADKISQLRYSKLYKEYPFYASETDEWIEQNQKDDTGFYLNYVSELEAQIRNEGPHIAQDLSSLSFRLNRSLHAAITSLTVNPQRRNERVAADVFDYFDAAVFSEVVGQREISKNRLASFKRLAGDISNEERLAGSYERYDRLAYIKPGTPFFDVVLVVREQIPRTPLEQIHAFFNDVLDANAEGLDLDREQNVSVLLSRFAELSDVNLSSFKDPALADDLFFEYLQFADFIKRDERFLREEYLKILGVIERAYLKLLSNKEEAQEQQQFFIQDKLKRITTIRKKLEGNEMPFQAGRKAFILLYNQIEEMRPIASDKAVLAHFDTQLKELYPVLAFLRSNSADKVQSNFKQHYEVYAKRLDEARAVQSLLNDADGGDKISPFKREELASSVPAALREVGIKDVKITLPEDDSSTSVMIRDATFEGASFSAIYNTDTKVFSDIVLNGEDLPTAVKLQNSRVVFLVKLGKLELQDKVVEEQLLEKPSEKSMLERVVLSKLQEEFKKYEIEVEEKYIGLEDLVSDRVHVRLALIGQGSEAIVFSFDVGAKSRRVDNLVVQTITGEVKVNESFELAALSQRVQQISQRAIFEKQRTDEMKALIDVQTPQP